ncbi:autotransporter outer membrane beta-barrel domain-containing protein [Stenotrophomonas maltophilia]|uniref:autotransporter family protein n=1 Tax=Stenotrophomonas maltophilia TaxID=40324 RepID=UPI000F65D3C6|nr:autotransporter outer membrane beta-barrel domain-containing protein [Stenotrophomonas maltophilia]RRU70536.1 autotransporter outer membrane beta-barrel domain-containing protein [Stenotrophomonas maltophilia]
MRRHSARPQRCAMRPLARGLLLALAALPATPVLARDLDGQSATVRGSTAVEAWNLINGSSLTVDGGRTEGINSRDSLVTLRNGRVEALASGTAASIVLRGTSTLDMAGSALHDGQVTVADLSTARITGSTLHSVGASSRFSVGISLERSPSTSDADSTLIVDSSFVRAEASPGAVNLSNGHAVRLQQGTAILQNGTRVEGANSGVLLLGGTYSSLLGQPITLRVDNAQVASDNGAAIWVAPRRLVRYDITIANGSQLSGGDGHLLLVRPDGTASGEADVHFTVDDARLAGDITFDTDRVSGNLDVVLRNKAQVDGRFNGVTTADIGRESTWLMTGNSNVGALTLGATGTIGLGDGTTFNTLTVDEFTGNGGALLFNTVLGDDTSLTDTLVINGDANGQANVRVLNAGGAGAKTDRGIELIDIGGASNAQFDLVGRAVGGQYEYFLVKDANGNWYLRSELTTTPDPCKIDPTLPDCTPITPIDPTDPIDPVPVLRPEAGAYLANQFALDQMLRHTWRDRQGAAAAADGIRGWARVDATQSKLGAVNDQLDLRVDRSRLQLGADLGAFDDGRGRVGVMGTLAQSSATSRSQLTGYSARGKVEGGALGVYGNWAADALYVDASVQRGQFRNRVQGEGLAEERYDSDIWQSAVEAGYRFGVGQIGNTALSLQPELQLIYTDAKTDVHTEANGTVVLAAGNSDLSGRAGLRLQGESRSAAGASVSPYLAANWYRDGSGNGIAFDDEVLKAGIPRNRYELSAGARVEFRSGFSAWGGLGVMRGDHGYREATGNLSVAYTW